MDDDVDEALVIVILMADEGRCVVEEVLALEVGVATDSLCEDMRVPAAKVETDEVNMTWLPGCGIEEVEAKEVGSDAEIDCIAAVDCPELPVGCPWVTVMLLDGEETGAFV